MALFSDSRSGRAGRAVAALLILAGFLAVVRSPSPARASGDPVLLAAGDVAACGNYQFASKVTAQILQSNPTAAVAMLGDGAYANGDPNGSLDGTLADYHDCYDGQAIGGPGPFWGQPDIKARTRPTTGNHEYEFSPQGADYFTYWNGTDANGQTNPDGPAGPSGLGYYSYDLGGWHVIVLNAHCNPNQPGPLGQTALDGCGPDSTEGRWLAADLAAHPAACTLAYWHEPRFYSFTVAGTGSTTTTTTTTPTTATTAPTSGPNPAGTVPDNDPTMDAMWQILEDHHADMVLNGHRHVYERFGHLSLPSTPNGPGIPDPDGLREFVVGTGGGPAEHFLHTDPSTGASTDDPNAEKQIDKTYGVLKLTLHAGSYNWEFLGAKSAVLDSGSDTCHGAAPPTTDTTAPPTPTTQTPSPAPAGHSGYWMAGSDGRVYNFGDAQAAGDAPPSPGATTVSIRPTPTGGGYWVVDSAGVVVARGAAAPLPSLAPGALTAGERVTSLSPTPTGHGYWLFTTRGRVFTFGDAVSYGDMSGVPLNGPVLDSIATPTGRGYYMVASDGGVFAFGDAAFHGSMGGRGLNAPVRSLVPVPAGGGYWLVASDGGVFAFDAPFRGSMGGQRLSRPVTGMVPYGNGYLMVAEDGGIFDFSDRPFAGSLGSNPPAHPIVSVAAVP